MCKVTHCQAIFLTFSQRVVHTYRGEPSPRSRRPRAPKGRESEKGCSRAEALVHAAGIHRTGGAGAHPCLYVGISVYMLVNQIIMFHVKQSLNIFFSCVQ